jgi:predicted Fe-Mo cluster-binding NifX family protein
VLACWKWFNDVLKEAGVKVTEKNKSKVDEVIHKYIGEQSSYGSCSADWRKARTQIQGNERMKKELIAKLKALA